MGIRQINQKKKKAWEMVRKPTEQIFKEPTLKITATISDENFSEYLIKNLFFVNGKHGAANRAKTWYQQTQHRSTN